MDETEKPVEKKIADYVRIVKEAVIFYTTAFFVLLLIFSCVSFCLLVPFVIGEMNGVKYSPIKTC